MIELIIPGRKASIGAMEVARILPFRERRMVGPFIFLDHGGPLRLGPNVPRELDVLPHPHIGLSTVSYLLAGEWMHRDSTGVEQPIRPGEVNWMTAGKGVTHSERFEGRYRETGGPLELLQAWVALPDADELREPTFHHHDQDALPAFGENGFSGRLVVGTAYGHRSPVPVRSPLFYVHAELEAGAVLGLPAEHPERAIYVVRGRIAVGHRACEAGQMAVFAPGASPILKAEERSTVMLLGGEPVGPRHIWWNFVASSKARIEEAKADWQAGRFALPYHDGAEFVPLPPDTRVQAPPHPLS